MRGGFPRLAFVALLMAWVALPLGRVAAEGSGYAWEATELNWYGISQRRLNDTRADSGKPLLTASDYLWGLAHERARDMAARGYLSQTTPEGHDAGAYMRTDGARYERWVEFRADDQSNRSEESVTWEIMTNLLNDGPARSAIVDDYDELGVALVENNGRRVFVILLAKSAPPPPPPPPAPARATPPAPPPPAARPTTVTGIIMAAAARYGANGDHMVRVARCESGLNPRAYNAAGPYIGLFQFHPSTFAAYGGAGRDIYSAYDQADVAARMFARGLASHWPVCSRR